MGAVKQDQEEIKQMELQVRFAYRALHDNGNFAYQALHNKDTLQIKHWITRTLCTHSFFFVRLVVLYMQFRIV